MTKTRSNLLVLLFVIAFAMTVCMCGCKKSDTKPVNPERNVTITMKGKGCFWYNGNTAYGNPSHTGNAGERNILTDGISADHFVSISCQADNLTDTMSIIMDIQGVAIYRASGIGKQQLKYQN